MFPILFYARINVLNPGRIRAFAELIGASSSPESKDFKFCKKFQFVQEYKLFRLPSLYVVQLFFQGFLKAVTYCTASVHRQSPILTYCRHFPFRRLDSQHSIHPREKKHQHFIAVSYSATYKARGLLHYVPLMPPRCGTLLIESRHRERSPVFWSTPTIANLGLSRCPVLFSVFTGVIDRLSALRALGLQTNSLLGFSRSRPKDRLAEENSPLCPCGLRAHFYINRYLFSCL